MKTVAYALAEVLMPSLTTSAFGSNGLQSTLCMSRIATKPRSSGGARAGKQAHAERAGSGGSAERQPVAVVPTAAPDLTT